jgi:tRNA (adenine22-N1)-methyltransferase
MNIQKLSKRLEAVTTFIPEGSVLADIGSDHAYLPCYVVNKGLVEKAIAGEVVEGPYQSALKQVMEANLADKISVRKGDGLEVLEMNEATVVTIAGMGGTLITNILERGKEKLSSVKRLILQPNIHAINIRKWLIENGWELINERILEEDGKIYEILVAEKGDPLRPYKEQKEAALLMGPFLMKEKNDVFIKKWTMEKNHWKRILTQLEKSEDQEATQEKRNELHKKWALVEEVLAR